MSYLNQFVKIKVVVEYQKPNFQNIKNKIDSFTFHLYLEYFLLLVVTGIKLVRSLLILSIELFDCL